jgi:two-component system, sensor histidine kinase and response regulator
MINKENIFNSAPFGYALHKIVLNISGKPVDYEFIDVNEVFERLTGLKKENIIGKTVKEAIPGIDKDKFDWICFYGKVALENSSEIFEHFSKPLGKYYSVHAYSPEKEYFVTIFTEVIDKIEEATNLFRITETANLGTWEWNIQTGEIIVNEKWAEIIGYKLVELSPVSFKTWEKLSHPDDFKKSNEMLSVYFQGKSSQYQSEVRMKHKKGHWVWVLDTGKVTQWTEDGKPLRMSGIHQEITACKKVELQLYQKLKIEKLLNEILSDFIHTTDIDASIIKSFVKLGEITQASRVYLFMIDAEKGTISNTHEWCAEGVTAEKDNLQNLPINIFPWTMKKLNNKEIIDIPDVSKMPSEANMEQEILESQNIKSLVIMPVYAENQLKGFVGFDNVLSTGLWSEKDTQFLGLLANILSNVIIRKLNEDELRLLTRAVKDSPVSTVITDFQGTISFVNSAFEQNTGYKAHEALGINFSIFNSGMQPISFYDELWNTILAGNIWQGEVRNKSKSGKIFWTRELISPIKQNDKITHFVIVAQDITENKKFLNELLDAKLKAEESDRLKSAFLATMNHELRTPLNHILGFSDMIPDMTDDENIKEFARLIHGSGLNLLNIIEDIFDLAMIEQSEIKIREDLVFVRDIYADLKKQLQEVLSETNKTDNIWLNSKIDSRLATMQIITDKPKVIQVMSNIIKNAIKYTENGEISISLILEERNYLSIILKDTGIGIPKEKLKVIFDFFRQGDDSHTRKYGGVGIGLAISNRIANVIGGTIKVESDLNKGSEFTFSFPITTIKENIVNPQEENTSFMAPNLSSKSILIVEDDTIGMGMIVNLLKSSKCKIINAVNGKEAVETIKDNPKIDIILMDLKMPVMDGFEATRAIRKVFPDLPIIALTAFSLQKDKEKALNAGCTDIITKPVSKEILFKKLQNFLVK